MIHLDEYESIETHWKTLYENVKYFDNFEVERIPKKIRKTTGTKIL